MMDKWGRRLFISGAVTLLIVGLVHSVSFFAKQVAANDTERQLLDLMANYRFNLMGSVRSMNNLLRGFSISFMLAALVMGAVDLVICRERAALLKRVALVNTIWLATMTAVSLRYFFLMPTSFLVVTLLFFALAWWKLPGSTM